MAAKDTLLHIIVRHVKNRVVVLSKFGGRNLLNTDSAPILYDGHCCATNNAWVVRAAMRHWSAAAAAADDLIGTIGRLACVNKWCRAELQPVVDVILAVHALAGCSLWTRVTGSISFVAEQFLTLHRLQYMCSWLPFGSRARVSSYETLATRSSRSTTQNVVRLHFPAADAANVQESAAELLIGTGNEQIATFSAVPWPSVIANGDEFIWAEMCDDNGIDLASLEWRFMQAACLSGNRAVPMLESLYPSPVEDVRRAGLRAGIRYTLTLGQGDIGQFRYRDARALCRALVASGFIVTNFHVTCPDGLPANLFGANGRIQ